MLRVRGCPVSVAEQVLMLVKLGGGEIANPYFDMSEALRFSSCYFSWRTRAAMRRLLGGGYNVPGFASRGEAQTSI